MDNFTSKHEQVMKEIVLFSAKTFAEHKITFNDSVPISTTVMLQLVSHAVVGLVKHIGEALSDETRDAAKEYITMNIDKILESVRSAVSVELDMIRDQSIQSIDKKGVQ